MKKFIFTLLVCALSSQAFAQINGYDAIIVGENVRLRAEPNLKCAIVGGLNTGLLVEILDETSKREVIGTSGNSCASYGYKWYKIRTSTNITGWVFGKFIFEVVQYTDEQINKGWIDELVDSKYTISGKNLHYSYAYDVSYPPDDSMGLTGCDDLTLPIFYSEGQKVAYPLRYMGTDNGWPAQLWTTGDKDWLVLMSGEGGSDNITEISESGNHLHIKIDRGFQDGGASVNLELRFKGTYFEAHELSFEDRTPNSEGY